MGLQNSSTGTWGHKNIASWTASQEMPSQKGEGPKDWARHQAKLACHPHEFGSSSAGPRIEFNASAEDEPISGGSLEVESWHVFLWNKSLFFL